MFTPPNFSRIRKVLFSFPSCPLRSHAGGSIPLSRSKETSRLIKGWAVSLVRVGNSIILQAHKAGLNSHLSDFLALITDKADLESGI